jgi:hypothetical protein
MRARPRLAYVVGVLSWISLMFVELLTNAPGAAAMHPQSPTLSGDITGTAVMSRTIPDVGSDYSLRGSGRLNLGAVTVSGVLQGTGFIARGTCSGNLVLKGRTGTLSLALRSPAAVPGFTTCSAYDWQVTRSTGSFAGTTGHGSLAVTIRGSLFTMRFT